jgi:predicted nucleic acid-binding protein
MLPGFCDAIADPRKSPAARYGLVTNLEALSRPRIFLDTSALFAGVLSASGGARLLLRLAEAGAIELWIGSYVLREADAVLHPKAPSARADMALLLDRAHVHLATTPGSSHLAEAETHIDYPPDARVLAEALSSRADWFVTLDRRHFLENPGLDRLAIRLGTPGDCVAWLRERWTTHAES